MTSLFLALAIVAETGWALAMKVSDGLRRPGPAAATVVLYILSLVLLATATRKLDVGTAYAIWAGAGAALIAIAGMVWFKEPATAGRIASLALIVAGIIGLRLTSGAP